MTARGGAKIAELTVRIAATTGSPKTVYKPDDKSQRRAGQPGDRDYRYGEGHHVFGFADLDRDRDGRISRQEWRASDQSFRRHDNPGDGLVS